MNLTVLFITLWFIYFTAKIDYSHISEGQYFNSHNYRFSQRLSFFGVIAIYNWQIGIASSLMFLTLFDAALNIMLQAPLFYLGNTAKWDRFFRKRIWLYIPIKLIAFIISVILFLYA